MKYLERIPDFIVGLSMVFFCCIIPLFVVFNQAMQYVYRDNPRNIAGYTNRGIDVRQKLSVRDTLQMVLAVIVIAVVVLLAILLGMTQ